MTIFAEGQFDVKNAPQKPADPEASADIGRFALAKQYHGDLDATAKGEMLGSGNPATGNAGYVAIEHVSGTLHGRRGSFALQHFGVMENGDFELNVRIVPDSGTGQLQGIAGSMSFSNSEGTHSYRMNYTVPEDPR
jgi:Protein of unknown function (DUF3224)